MKPNDLVQVATAIRTRAARARRLADALSDDTDRERLIRYAAELEEDAHHLETRATPFPETGAVSQISFH